jgi:hypothetical protein
MVCVFVLFVLILTCTAAEKQIGPGLTELHGCVNRFLRLLTWWVV